MDVVADFLRVYADNGTELFSMAAVLEYGKSSQALLHFSKGEAFGGIPGLQLPVTTLHCSELIPLSHIPEKWLAVSHLLNDSSKVFPWIIAAHATLSFLKELWYLSNPDWRAVRNRVHVGLVKSHPTCGNTSVSQVRCDAVCDVCDVCDACDACDVLRCDMLTC
jgi:hypothetical protein